ncbi:protein of unknown function [Pseudodesulfovibrio profundus]|uniref:Uncharacterized protein n=1 Tax=Pseudodesulfovibrio profundus TaxID=57320 RepID=A0A2C8FCH8_9BACT|nr:protein of unknown function [Pseudodesulfovibrio profundus]
MSAGYGIIGTTCLGLRDWQANMKMCSFAHGGIDGDGPIVALDDLVRDEQTDACAVGAFR